MSAMRDMPPADAFCVMCDTLQSHVRSALRHTETQSMDE
jgi:hypothetical protein